jgi:hypothetical protein
MGGLSPERVEPKRGASSFTSPKFASSGDWSSPCAESGRSVVSEDGVGSIGVWLFSAVPVRASTVPMLVWAGGSALVCVAVPSLCSLVAVVVASVDALATWADVVVASAPTTSASAAAVAAAG